MLISRNELSWAHPRTGTARGQEKKNQESLQPHERLKVQVAGEPADTEALFFKYHPGKFDRWEGFVHPVLRSPYVCAMASILTYNVNGFASALNKGWDQWIGTVVPDIVFGKNDTRTSFPSGTWNNIGYGACGFRRRRKAIPE